MVKNIFVTMAIFVTGLMAREWVETGAPHPSEPVWDVNLISENQLEISFDFSGYFVEELPNGKNKIFLVGDSHFAAIMFDLKQRVVDEDYQFLARTSGGCLYLPNFIRKEVKRSLRQTLVMQGNRSIRVDTYGLFGQAMGVFIGTSENMQFLDPSKGKVYLGAEVKRILEKLLGTQIDFREHLRIFVGHIPRFEFLKVENSRLNSNNNQYILQAKDLKRSGKVILNIDAMTLLPLEMTRIEEGQKRYFVKWQDYETIGSIDWPHLVTLEFPGKDELIRVKYNEPTLNVKIDPKTFKLIPTFSPE